jgi:hypothetical protein
MEIIQKPRGTWKSYDLVCESARTGCPILTYNEMAARRLKERADKLGIDIPFPLTVSNIRERFYYGRRRELIIDDLDLVLEKFTDCKIKLAALTPDYMKPPFEKNGCDYLDPTKITVSANAVNDTPYIFGEPYDVRWHWVCTAIKDVNVIVPNKVVEVTFEDGSKEKSVCNESDTFSLEQAISICLAKKMFGGTKAYNKAIKKGLKAYEFGLKKEEEKKAEQERIALKRQKRTEKKARQEAAKKEEAIEIQKEAYLRAMRAMKSEI